MQLCLQCISSQFTSEFYSGLTQDWFIQPIVFTSYSLQCKHIAQTEAIQLIILKPQWCVCVISCYSVWAVSVDSTMIFCRISSYLLFWVHCSVCENDYECCQATRPFAACGQYEKGLFQHSCFVYKMAENDLKKSWSVFPKAQDDVLKCPFLSTTQR